MIDMKKTGQRIKDVCNKNAISVKKIQQELHIGSFQAIYNWFQGKTLPTLDNLYYLSKLLEVSMDALIVETVDDKLDSYSIIDVEEWNGQRVIRLEHYRKRLGYGQ